MSVEDPVTQNGHIDDKIQVMEQTSVNDDKKVPYGVSPEERTGDQFRHDQNGTGSSHPAEIISSGDEEHGSSPALGSSSAAEDPSSISSPEKAARSVPRREERRRLWFVRMPKPPEILTKAADGPKDDVNVELESYNIRIGFLNESLGVIRIERDAASQVTQAAHADLNNTRQVYESQKAEAEPKRAHRKQLRDIHASLQTEFMADYNELPAKSEEELDQMIYNHRHEMEHGSSNISLADEKKRLVLISKLDSQRAKVKDYGKKSAALREAKAEVSAAVSSTKELEAEVQSLWEHMSTQRTIVDERRAAENKVRAAYKKVQDEKTLVLGQRDELRARLYAARAGKNQRGRHWGDNRKFSQQIRVVLGRGEGALDEATHLCADQINRALEQLAEDSEFRNEYFDLWEGQRKHPTSAYEEQSGLNASGATRGGAHAAEAASTERAQKMIADVLARADENARLQKQQQAESAQTAERPSASAATGGTEGPDASAATAAASAAAAAAVGNAPAATATKKPSRRTSRPPPPVVVPNLDVHAFELPSAAVKPAAAANDAQTEKQRIRAQNRTAAAEAERRKERQRKAAEERRKAAEGRRVRAEQDKAAADKAARESATALPFQQQPLFSSVGELSVSAASAIGGAAADVSSAAVAQGKQLVDDVAKAVSKSKHGAAVSAVAKQRTALPKPEPRARVPARRRANAMKSVQKAAIKANSALQAATRQYWPAMQDDTNLVALLLGAVLMFVLALFLVFML